MDVVEGKVADLTLSEVEAPEGVAPTEEVQRAKLRKGSWRDGNEVNALAVCVWVGRKILLAVDASDRSSGRGVGSEVFSDEFWPAAEGEGRA